jgi:DNA polymerase-3 subunit epsilon
MWRLRLRRWRWLQRGQAATPLQKAWAGPLPAAGTLAQGCCFLVCDAEMSGLDPAAAQILSLGWVRVNKGEIQLESAEHHLIRNRESVGQSAVVHQLRDCELREAGSLEDALEAMLRASRGCVLVFHNARLDMAFLDRASRRLLGAPLLLPVVDTLLQEQRLMQRRQQTPGPGGLRLQACRDRYGLGAHAAHNALSDALATAELLLAHISGRGAGLRLRDLL